MSEKVTRCFYLKKAVITKDTSDGIMPKTLKAYMEQVFSKYPKADSRKHRLSEDSDRFRVMNDWEFLGSKKDVCAASIFAFTMNANQNAVELAPNCNSFPISQLAPNRNDKQHQEFVEGLVWFAVLGNYMAIMTNQAVSFSVLEDYLSWIITKACEYTVSVSIEEPQRVSLRNCDMSNASKIVISNGMSVEPVQRNNDKGRKILRAAGHGWKVFTAICNVLNCKPPRLPIESENALDLIDVDVVISAHRAKSEPGRMADAIERMANTFKDVPNAPVRVKFSDGREVSLDEYRVKKTFQIEADNKIPRAASVCALLDSWLRAQVGAINSASI